jgi:hypothetical protein
MVAEGDGVLSLTAKANRTALLDRFGMQAYMPIYMALAPPPCLDYACQGV